MAPKALPCQPSEADTPLRTEGKEKISDEEAERRDDDVYGDVHVQHVHVSSRSHWSTDFPRRYGVLLKQDEQKS